MIEKNVLIVFKFIFQALNALEVSSFPKDTMSTFYGINSHFSSPPSDRIKWKYMSTKLWTYMFRTGCLDIMSAKKWTFFWESTNERSDRSRIGNQQMRAVDRVPFVCKTSWRGTRIVTQVHSSFRRIVFFIRIVELRLWQKQRPKLH